MGLFSQTDVAADAIFVPFTKEDVNYTARDVAGGLSTGMGFGEFRKNDLRYGIASIIRRYHNLGKSYSDIGAVSYLAPTFLKNITEVTNELNAIVGEATVVQAAYFGVFSKETRIVAALQQYDYYTGSIDGVDSKFSVVSVGDGFVVLREDVTDYFADDPVYREFLVEISYDSSLQYTQIFFTTVAKPQHIRVLYIAENSTEYPFFNIQNNSIYSIDEYLPVVPIVENERSIGKYPDLSPEQQAEYESMGITNTTYTQTKNILKVLGLPLESITQSIDENEERGKLADAFVMYSVNLLSTKQAHLEYLFKYFEDIQTVSVLDKDDYFNSNQTVGNTLSFRSNRFRYTFGYSYIVFTEHTGVQTDVGKYKREIVRFGTPYYIPDYFTALGSLGRHDTALFIHKQITETTYITCAIVNPIGSSKVFKDDRAKWTHTTLLKYFDIGEDDIPDSGLYIPIGYKTLYKLSEVKRRELLNISGGILYFALDTYKRKWYETDLFRTILLVIAFVAAAWSGPQTFAAFLKVFPFLLAVFLFLAVVIITRIVIKIAVDLLVDIFGEEGALIFVIVLAVIAAAYGDNTTLSNYINSEMLLKATWSLIDGLAEYYQDVTEDIAKDLDVLQSKYNDAMAEVNEVLDSFKSNDAFLFGQRVSHILIPDETPSQFFTRTLASNVGVKALDMIDTYVSDNLRLPTITDTLR